MIEQFQVTNSGGVVRIMAFVDGMWHEIAARSRKEVWTYDVPATWRPTPSTEAPAAPEPEPGDFLPESEGG